MREKREFVFGLLIGVLIGIVMGIIIASSGCDPLDPQNSVNAVYLEEKPMRDQTPRFQAVYHSKNRNLEIYVYKDLEYPGCELILAIRTHNPGGVGVAYVVHPVRDTNIRIEP